LSAFYIYDFTIGIKENILKDGCLDDCYGWRNLEDICELDVTKSTLMGLVVIYMDDVNFYPFDLSDFISDYVIQDDGCISDALYLSIKDKVEELES